jgi:hypothetical protein
MVKTECEAQKRALVLLQNLAHIFSNRIDEAQSLNVYVDKYESSLSEKNDCSRNRWVNGQVHAYTDAEQCVYQAIEELKLLEHA